MSTDWKAIIKTETVRLRKQYDISLDAAFSLYMGSLLADLDEDTSFQGIRPSGSNDKGIDFFHVDDDSERATVMQCKYSAKADVSTKQSHLLALLNGLEWLEQPEQVALEGKPDLLAAAHEFQRALDLKYRIEIIYAAFGPPNSTVQRDA